MSNLRLVRGGLVLALCSSIAALPAVELPGPLAAEASQPRPARRQAEAPAIAPQASGRQPLVFVVHPTHPALEIGWKDAYGLVTGAVADWKPLDGRTASVRLVLGPAAAARLAGLWVLIGRVPRSLAIAASEQAAANAVGRDPKAIGLVAGEGLSPMVRAATLAGSDPVRDPTRYPLRVPGAAPGAVTTAIAFGDIMTSRTVDKRMRALGDFRSPFRSVAAKLKAADIAFGNFEGTISHDARPQPGGARFVSRTQVIEGLTYAGLDFLSLANNHVGDYGAGTLAETVDLLTRAGIAVAGAGADLVRARKPAIVERNGVRFAFVSFNAIIGTPAAGEDEAGALRIRMGPWFRYTDSDVARVAQDVKDARKKADVVIVYPHWGQEYVARPNADQVRVAHAMIDAGADMLIATHPHWVQGAEIYKGRLIAYSLGNFVFDQTWSKETQQGAAIDLVFWGPRLVGASFVPVQIEDAHRPRFVDDRGGSEILDRIWGASGEPYRAAA